jgi:hypothetical protein
MGVVLSEADTPVVEGGEGSSLKVFYVYYVCGAAQQVIVVVEVGGGGLLCCAGACSHQSELFVATQVGVTDAVVVPLFVEDPDNSFGSLMKKAAAISTGGWWLGGTHMVPNEQFLAKVRGDRVCRQTG